MVFYWSLNKRKSPQVSGTFLSIQADLNNVVVWIISIRPRISNSYSPLFKTLGIVPNSPITFVMTVTFMFHSFFYFPTFFYYQCVVRQDGKIHYYYYYYYCYLHWSFSHQRNWWSFTGVWVTASLLKSPGLFSVFWPFSIMLLFGWSPLVHQLPTPPALLVIL